MGKLENRSVDGEDFSTAMSELHEKVKQILQDTSNSYKKQANVHRKEVNIEVGYVVLAHLRKERFQRGEYNKLKMKKIGPCKILYNFSANAYELDLPPGISISPIFNVAYLYPYTVGDANQASGNLDQDDRKEQQWLKKMRVAKSLQAKQILDTCVAKKTRRKEYLEYLVKWKDHLMGDYTWMDKAKLQKVGHSMEDLMSRSS